MSASDATVPYPDLHAVDEVFVSSLVSIGVAATWFQTDRVIPRWASSIMVGSNVTGTLVLDSPTQPVAQGVDGVVRVFLGIWLRIGLEVDHDLQPWYISGSANPELHILLFRRRRRAPRFPGQA